MYIWPCPKSRPIKSTVQPPDYYMFLEMMKELSGHHSDCDNDNIAVVDHFWRSKKPASTKKGTICFSTTEINASMLDSIKLIPTIFGHNTS